METKGGEQVNPTNHEKDKQHVFDCFCKKVLRNETRNYYGEMERLQNKEVVFSEIYDNKISQLSTTDEYFKTEQIFKVMDCDVIVNDENLAKALRSLPERKREITILAYFFELTDSEIGVRLNMMRSTVQYQRRTTLRKLRSFLEEEIPDA